MWESGRISEIFGGEGSKSGWCLVAAVQAWVNSDAKSVRTEMVSRGAHLCDSVQVFDGRKTNKQRILLNIEWQKSIMSSENLHSHPVLEV